MSTIVEQLTEAQAAIAALTTERDALKASLEATVTQRDQAERMTRAMEDVASKQVEKSNAQIEDLTAKLEAETAAKATAEKAQAESAAELAKLKAAVASNPAFADAASNGAKPVADVGREIAASMTYPEFQKLSQSERMAFSVRGGRITA